MPELDGVAALPLVFAPGQRSLLRQYKLLCEAQEATRLARVLQGLAVQAQQQLWQAVEAAGEAQGLHMPAPPYEVHIDLDAGTCLLVPGVQP